MAFTSVAEKAKNRELINNLNNKRNTSGLLPTSMSLSSAVSQMKKVKEVGHQASLRATKVLTFAAPAAGPDQAPDRRSSGLLENIAEEGRKLRDSGLRRAD